MEPMEVLIQGNVELMTDAQKKVLKVLANCGGERVFDGQEIRSLRVLEEMNLIDTDVFPHRDKSKETPPGSEEWSAFITDTGWAVSYHLLREELFMMEPSLKHALARIEDSMSIRKSVIKIRRRIVSSDVERVARHVELDCGHYQRYDWDEVRDTVRCQRCENEANSPKGCSDAQAN
jgi:hypothetical protein